MTNKSNIFSVLPQDHSDDEDNQGTQQSRKEKKQTNKTNTGKAEEKSAPVQSSSKTQDAGKNAVKDEHKKKKQVPESGQHPLDRQSGTGQPAFDKKSVKKGGHGKGNVGNANKDGEEETKEEAGDEEKPQEEQKPEGITLEEYYAQSTQGAHSQVDQSKVKSVQEELTKDLLSKKATLYVKNKNQEEEAKPLRKTIKANVDHHASLNTEHADLLNFRTGFVEREFKERKEGDKPYGDRPYGDRPYGDKPYKSAPKKDEKTEEAPATTEEKTEVVEGEEQGEKGDDNKEKRGGRGGYRGGNRGGNNYRGSNRGGNRGGNYNNNSGSTKSAQTKINVEDDSAFPKLG